MIDQPAVPVRKRVLVVKGLAWRAARILAAAAAAIVLLVMLLEDKIIYFPTRYPEGRWNIGTAPAPEGQIVDSIGKIPAVGCPKLFIHSPDDEVVPYTLGQRLYEAATEPKLFLSVPPLREGAAATRRSRRYAADWSSYILG